MDNANCDLRFRGISAKPEDAVEKQWSSFGVR